MNNHLVCFKKSVILWSVIVYMLLCFMPSLVFSMSASKHIAAWVAMSEVALSNGGLGNKIPVYDFPNLQYIIDQPPGARGTSKRHCQTHNPQKMAKMLKDKWHSKAIFNAVCIHNVLDMVDLGPSGVNGHAANSKKRKEAQEAYGKIMNGKKVIFPEWSKKPGNLTKVVAQIDDFLREKARNSRTVQHLGKIVKIVPKVVRGVQILVVIYETKKMILYYFDTGNIDTQKLVESLGGSLGGIYGAREGAKFGGLLGGLLSGGIAGTKVGSVSGASFGSCFVPGAGTAAGGGIGAVIGGIIGAVGGGYAGYMAGESVTRMSFELLVPVDRETLNLITLYSNNKLYEEK